MAAKEIDVRPKGRAVFTYTIPESLRQTNSGVVVTSIGIAELTPMDEIDAAKASRGDATRLAFELAMRSLAEVNGKAVSLGDGSAENAWLSIGPKLRNLAMAAYSEINQAGEGSVSSFLKSRGG